MGIEAQKVFRPVIDDHVIADLSARFEIRFETGVQRNRIQPVRKIVPRAYGRRELQWEAALLEQVLHLANPEG